MPSFSEYWQAGFRALHIEENIGNAFADFAPYAGADEQRLVVTRQSSLAQAPTGTTSVGTPLGPASHISSSTTLFVEENGDFAVQARDASAGCITFSTAGQLQLDAAVRLPLPLPLSSFSQRAAATSSSERDKDSVIDASAVPPTQPAQIPPQEKDHPDVPSHPVVKPAASQLRFSDFTRPVTLPTSAFPPASAATDEEGKNTSAYGQVELDASVPDWDSNRQSYGARFGPVAVRLTRTFSAAATATATEAASAELQNSASLSDEDVLTRTVRLERARRYQRTLDAALCVPLGGGQLYDANARASTASPASDVVTRTLQGHRIALRTAPWALTCGLQLPLDIGDTLVGISLQNDRATSITLPYPGVEWAVSADASGAASDAGEGAACVACVPSAIRYDAVAAAANAEGGASATTTSKTEAAVTSATAALPSYFAVPYVTFRFLMVQTLASHTLERGSSPSSSPLRDSSLDASLNASGATRMVSSYDWRRLPTLIGVNVGVDRERLRLSAASIVHDASMDLELAGVLDLTPWTPRMPTLLKVGYNNVGRLAAGVTSLFYGTVTATLGVHMAREEQTKFGLEVKF